MHSLLLAAALATNCLQMVEPFIGTYCAPSDNERHAAVLLLGGEEGGDSLGRAAEVFADHGYVAVSVVYFGAGDLPGFLVNVPVETVTKTVDAVAALKNVDPKRIGILGVSKGGELALLAASFDSRLKAVVAVVPAPLAYMGLGKNDLPTGCSWTRNGNPLPCVAAGDRASAMLGRSYTLGEPVVLRTFYDASRRADPQAARKAFFHLERIAGPVLCLAGRDDGYWNSPDHCTAAIRYLQDRRHPYADREAIYPDAGHSFITALRGPDAAVTEIVQGDTHFVMGGTREGNYEAARAAWKAIWSFFSRL